MSKGDKPRPPSITPSEYRDKFDKAFGKTKRVNGGTVGEPYEAKPKKTTK